MVEDETLTGDGATYALIGYRPMLVVDKAFA